MLLPNQEEIIFAITRGDIQEIVEEFEYEDDKNFDLSQQELDYIINQVNRYGFDWADVIVQHHQDYHKGEK